MQLGKIGFLDPGFAGLTILRAVVGRLPTHDYIYLACGVQAQAADKGVNFLLAQGCSIIVIPSIRLFPHFAGRAPAGVEFFGVAAPVAADTVARTDNNRVGIITRNDTKCAELFAAEIKQVKPGIKIYQQACPLLVPLIEAGRHHTGAIETVLRGYLGPLMRGGIDVLILGNLHYELIQDTVQRLVEPKVHVISQGVALAAKLAEYLGQHQEIEKQLNKQSQQWFYCTEDSKKTFDVLASEFYGSPISAAQVTL